MPTQRYQHPQESRSTRFRPAALFIALMLWSVLSGQQAPARAAESSVPLPKVLRAGFLSRIYHDIDPRDAKAATELLAKEVSRNMGLATNPIVTIFPDMPSLVAAMKRGELDMISLPTLDYLRIRDSVPLIPTVVGAHNAGRGTSYLLIARRDGNIRRIGDLKGKAILLLPAGRHEASRLWLELLVARIRGGAIQNFFGTVKEYPKVSQSAMAVFFKQADAALVTRAAYETGKLLNPQTARDLVVIAESDYYSDGVTCFPAYVAPNVRSTISAAISNLNMTVTGRQLYTIFQTSGTVPFKPEFLKGLETLIQEHKVHAQRPRSTRRQQ